MMNIQSAIRQMRVARRLGKLSLAQQNRIMRRIQPRPSTLTWERMMALRASIAKDVAPILQARREAERDCFDIKFEAEPVKQSAPVKVSNEDKCFFTKMRLTGRLVA